MGPWGAAPVHAWQHLGTLRCTETWGVRGQLGGNSVRWHGDMGTRRDTVGTWGAPPLADAWQHLCAHPRGHGGAWGPRGAPLCTPIGTCGDTVGTWGAHRDTGGLWGHPDTHTHRDTCAWGCCCVVCPQQHPGDTSGPMGTPRATRGPHSPQHRVVALGQPQAGTGTWTSMGVMGATSCVGVEGL